ncbi:Rpn family recombination-promoting nuclease/putative transposase [Nocardia aurantia]|uniref:Transposase (putative) YhgA-like domain-containing protein n=1 Tax=Nocardia aurantia TaxID=2585199 RepID=A0A7K0DNS3_9NOCA|nr:Rpn family recombination-promoting nuclease/putative transposase [Nocardia aurantia]MQY27393.1 hypothetical protein [Nocardia aurantia]
MAETPPTPYDSLFKKLLGRPGNAAAELRPALPEVAAARIDWRHLKPYPGSFVRPDLRQRHADLMLETRLIDGPQAFLYCLIEHQSSPDPVMAYRLEEYRLRFWSAWLDRHPGAGKLPMVIPLVMHCSSDGRRWNAALDLADLIDLDEHTRAALGELVPRSPYLLDDVNRLDASAMLALRQPPELRMLKVLLRFGPGNPALIDLITQDYGPDLHASFNAAGGDQLFEYIMRYILTVTAGSIGEDDLEPLYDLLGPKARDITVTLAEKFEARGEARGRAESLLDLMRVKFRSVPSEVRDVVRAADVAQLRTWTERMLTADTLDGVFG